MLIDGKMVGSEQHFNVINPYTQEIVGKAPLASQEQIQEALEKAAKTRYSLAGSERAAILERIAELLKEHQEEFAQLITQELGACIKQSRYELDRSYAVFQQAATLARTIDDEDVTAPYVLEKNEKAKLTVISEPLRLVVGITPFNHPLNQIAHKIAPAIAAGTTIVLKPSEKTPLTVLKFGALIQDIVPAGMVNIITGYPPQDIVDQLITHPAVELVSFTGGVEVGKYIVRTMNQNGKELTKKVMELGGSSPLLILEDADLDLAATIATGTFDNVGQRCTAIRRIIIDEKVADVFLARFVEKAAKLRYGNPQDATMDMGCLINEAAAITIQQRVEKALQHGSKLLYGNKRIGALYSPTILDQVDPHEELVMKETFGPVASILRVKNTEDAITVANRSPYRLAGGVMTTSKEKAIYVASRLRVGQFNWNGAPSYRTEQAPFGGFGDSGNYEKEGVIMAAQGMRLIRTFYEHSQP